MNEEKSVEVIQADRDAAADLHEVWTGYGETGRTKAMRAGNIDKHDFVQAFARHRLRSTTPPAADAVEAVSKAIVAALGREGLSHTGVQAAARAAISAYDRRGVDAREAALEEAAITAETAFNVWSPKNEADARAGYDIATAIRALKSSPALSSLKESGR